MVTLHLHQRVGLGGQGRICVRGHGRDVILDGWSWGNAELCHFHQNFCWSSRTPNQTNPLGGEVDTHLCSAHFHQELKVLLQTHMALPLRPPVVSASVDVTQAYHHYFLTLPRAHM